MLNSSLEVCFVACDVGSAVHFAAQAEALRRRGCRVRAFAVSGPAIQKFQEQGLHPESFHSQGSKGIEYLIARIGSTAAVVLTSVGNFFAAKLHGQLAIRLKQVSRWAYYDNPEPFVPGGYSSTAAMVMESVQVVLFANQNLANIPIYYKKGLEFDFSGKPRVGLGYYPIDQAEKIALTRRHLVGRAKLRAQIVSPGPSPEDTTPSIWVYFGGNNTVYFSHALPAFLRFLTEALEREVDLSRIVILLQQHPGAKKDNYDAQQILDWVSAHGNDKGAPILLLSNLSSDQAQVAADVAFYYQTSMGPQFILAGIPTIQIGHETYSDILVKNALIPSVCNTNAFLEIIPILIEGALPKPEKEMVLKGLGIRENWADFLQQTLEIFLTHQK